ncbi:hypothetical protein ACA910_006798 [Epithemia clementina (nom. ined.)]
MFRKFADRISAAASNAFSTSTTGDNNQNNEENVQRLTALGFDRTQATQALQATNGNVDQAAELLLASVAAEPSPSSARPPQRPATTRHRNNKNNNNKNNNNNNDKNNNNNNNHHHHNNNQEEEDLRRALEASLEVSNLPPAPQKRTAAMQKAAEAAEVRNRALQQPSGNSNNKRNKQLPKQPPTSTRPANDTKTVPYNTTSAVRLSTASQALAANHPGVKLIPKLQDKTVEEQILRCADRLKSSPAAVDTLYRACVTIHQHPNETKYRTIDTSTAAFQRSLAPAPGALDLLTALNFHSVGSTTTNNHKLVLGVVDPARLYLAISALEQTKLTPEYIKAKQRIQLSAELAKIQLEVNHSQNEALRRAALLALCPTEPPEGRGAWMQVALADHETIRRRFDADDTLQDVLHWMAASQGSVLLDKLLVSREWMLQDINRYPIQPMDCVKHGTSTLQYLGCWPSGRLELVMSSDEWKQQQQQQLQFNYGTTGAGDTAVVVRGSARGLGAAPKDAL